MKFDVVFDVDVYNDGQAFRRSGSFTVNGVISTVPIGTIDFEELVVESIEAQLGRSLTEVEIYQIGDAVYNLHDFDIVFS